jgi:hypothetical protein
MYKDYGRETEHSPLSSAELIMPEATILPQEFSRRSA